MSDDPRGDVCRLQVFAGQAATEVISWGHMAWFASTDRDRAFAMEKFREGVTKINAALAAFDAPTDEPETDEPDDPDDDEAECTCVTPPPHPTDIEPPEPKLDPYCPTHGTRDADQEFEAWRDRKHEREAE